MTLWFLLSLCRYASGGGGNDSYSYAPSGPSRRNIPTEVAAGQSGYSSGTATDDEGDDTEVLWSEESAVGQMAEEEEDMRRREDELKEELSLATLRCDQLKRTLLETKSFIDPKVHPTPEPAPIPSTLFLLLTSPVLHRPMQIISYSHSHSTSIVPHPHRADIHTIISLLSFLPLPLPLPLSYP